MASLSRRSRKSSTDIWPGFVDVLSNLLMIIIFLLMVYVIAQFFLNEAISGRDEALQRLENQVSELSELLGLERTENTELRLNISQLSQDLQASVNLQDDLKAQVQSLSVRAENAERQAAETSSQLEDAFKTIMTDKGAIEMQLTQLNKLANDIAALKALKADMEKELTDISVLLRVARDEASRNKEELERTQDALIAKTDELSESERTLSQKQTDLEKTREELEKSREELTARLAELVRNRKTLEDRAAELSKSRDSLTEKERLLLEEREISESTRAQVALLNRQMEELRKQLSQLSTALEASEQIAEEQRVKIANLGQRLNAALATKVQELSRYRSEFFGRLREILGDRRDVRIVGDRFVFQSEVLFASGSAVLGEEGQAQIAQLATALREISATIPSDIDWILQVNGHTDKIPISTARYASNWELSAARAISVVQYLIGEGIPPERMAAAGFGEFQPIDPNDDEIAYRRNRRIEFKLTQR